MSETFVIKTEGLDKLLKALKGKLPVARIGVLGGNNVRNQSVNTKGTTPTNAEVGTAHEYGAPGRGLPQRSFLRVPLTEHLNKYLQNSGALDKDTLALVIKEGTFVPWLRKVAIVAESVVSDAFDTGGFGKWPAWSDANYSNNSGQLLVDTKQLRESITSEVKE